MSLGGAEVPELPAPMPGEENELDSEEDGFAGSDAAAGGDAELGRERR
jgi:hypothetical protein